MTKKMIQAREFGRLLHGHLCDNYTIPAYVPPKEVHPWDNIHLTKEERKGKTFEELQTLRKEKWEVTK